MEKIRDETENTYTIEDYEGITNRLLEKIEKLERKDAKIGNKLKRATTLYAIKDTQSGEYWCASIGEPSGLYLDKLPLYTYRTVDEAKQDIQFYIDRGDIEEGTFNFKTLTIIEQEEE